MAIRFDDEARTVTLGVRDLAEAGGPRGHLSVDVVQRLTTRAAQGRAIHTRWQAQQAADDASYRAEVRLQHQTEVDGWTVSLHGRVDGLTEVAGHSVVEEVKSTALDAGALYASTLADWPSYVAQLEVYLWMLHEAGHGGPVGRLVLVSIADGSQHVLGVSLDASTVAGRVQGVFEGLVARRERRMAWMASRRARIVPPPHEAWRPGQQELADAVGWSVSEGRVVLAEAPTGLGKTAAVMVGALRAGLALDKQVFWATSKTTQQAAPLATLELLAERGLPLRAVRLRAKEKACLNDVVVCTPDRCPFAESYHDKVREHGILETLVAEGRVTAERLEDVGRSHQVCPFELALDLSSHVDVVVGDINYVFDPGAHLRRHFTEPAAKEWIVVVDEAHQLVERARGWLSPELRAVDADRAQAALEAAGPAYQPFAQLAWEVAELVRDEVHRAPLPERGTMSRAHPDVERLADLADRIDAVGLDYALITQRAPYLDEGEDDPWKHVGRQVLRMAQRVDEMGDDTVPLLDQAPGAEVLRLLCLDPGPWLGPRIGRLSGLAACSATLSPHRFYLDLLGLGDRKDTVDRLVVPSPFPAERRPVWVAPRVSTLFRDREAHAPRTARLLQEGIEAVPGNVAVYFPSFAMLDDLVDRWTLARPVLRQVPGMRDDERAAQLAALADADGPVVLAAVLGGIFAEGIDLPPGALSAAMIVSPALPPVGLERDLLREHFEQRFGEGFAYASLIPGMTKVVQAAGRLIRRPEDRGVVWLVGRRFRWRDVSALLPEHWPVEQPEDPVEATRTFFAESTLSS